MSLPGVRARYRALLRAALGSGPSVRADWLAWLSRVHIGRLDMGSTRLPLLASFNVKANGVSDEEVPPRIAGLIRHNWARTQSLLHAARQALEGLVQAGVEVMLIKGAAFLVQGYGGDARLRPLADVDLLVRPQRMAEAESVLRGSGWERGAPELDGARCFVRAGALRLCLHAQALMESAGRGRPEDEWADSCATEFPGGGPRVLVPGATSLLLHGCVYGLFPPLPAPIRWIADTVQLLRRRRAEVDCSAFVRDAERIGVRPHVREALAALAPFVPVPPPPAAGTLAERTEYWICSRFQRLSGPVPRWWFHARRQRMPFLRHLAGVFGLAHTSELPGLRLLRAAHRWPRVLGIRFD